MDVTPCTDRMGMNISSQGEVQITSEKPFCTKSSVFLAGGGVLIFSLTYLLIILSNVVVTGVYALFQQSFLHHDCLKRGCGGVQSCLSNFKKTDNLVMKGFPTVLIMKGTDKSVGI